MVADLVDKTSSAVTDEEQVAVSREADATEAQRERHAAAEASLEDWWTKRQAG